MHWMWKKINQERLKEMESEPREGDRLFSTEELNSASDDSRDVDDDFKVVLDSDEEEKILRTLEEQRGSLKNKNKRKREEGVCGDEALIKKRKPNNDTDSDGDIEMETTMEYVDEDIGDSYVERLEKLRIVDSPPKVVEQEKIIVTALLEPEVVEEVIIKQITPIKLTKNQVQTQKQMVNQDIRRKFVDPSRLTRWTSYNQRQPDVYKFIQPWNLNKKKSK